MKRYRGMLTILIVIILLSISFPTVIYANSAEPPCFTVIVSNPPEDLSLYLLLPDKTQAEPIVLNKEQKAWETYYRFFYHMPPIREAKLDDAVLVVKSKDHSFQYPLPADAFKKYNNLLTLDLKAERLTMGQSPLRVPLLVALRVVLTLLIEGLIFFFFGYREIQNWAALLTINILTQTGLNAMITGPGISSYWVFGFIFLEILVLIVEMIALISFVREHKRSRTVLYVITANLASLFLGGFLIAYLPV